MHWKSEQHLLYLLRKLSLHSAVVLQFSVSHGFLCPPNNSWEWESDSFGRVRKERTEEQKENKRQSESRMHVHAVRKPPSYWIFLYRSCGAVPCSSSVERGGGQAEHNSMYIETSLQSVATGVVILAIAILREAEPSE